MKTTVYKYSSKSLGQEYYDANLPVVQQQLIAAGIRLSNLLTKLY